MSPANSTARPKSTREHHDWARSPSALVVFILLGIASLSGIMLSASRLLTDPGVQQTRAATETRQSTETGGSAPSDAPQGLAHSPAIKRIDINSASIEELDLLPGIGPALGQRIIQYRSEHGPFSRIEDITSVSGIGPRTLEKLRPLVHVGQSSAEARADTGDDG